MPWPKLCITYYVERFLLRASFCAVLFMATAPFAFADSGKYIVKLKQNNSIHPLLRPLARQESAKKLAEKANKNPRVKATALQHVDVILAEGTKEDIEAALKGNSDIAYIEEDKIIHLAEADNFAASATNSPYLNTMGLTATNPSHNVTANGTPLLVAVIDTGIDLDHPFLVPFLSTNNGEIANNGRDDDGNGFVDDYYGANVTGSTLNGDVQDVYDHGTHVAGLVKVVRDQAIALGYNEARNIQVLPIRFFYNCGSGLCGTTSGAIQALNYALSRGSKIVNMSWGSEGMASYSQALYETLVELYNSDIVLVAAAGNEGTDIDTTPFFPAALNSSIPGLISVNSITTSHNSATGELQSQYLSYFSNYGAQRVDIAAPGSSWFQIGGLLSADADHVAGEFDGKFIGKSGTSMASPIVAGVAAVVRTINSNLNAFDVKELILQNATVPMNGATKILLNKNRTDGYVHAINAFEAADMASGSGILPAATSSNFTDKSYGSEAPAAGCGTVGGSSPGAGNPFGGNSMGLFTALFFLVQFARKVRYKLARC